MGKYGAFVFGTLVVVIVAGAFYAVSGPGGGDGNGGSVSGWFRTHRDWFLVPYGPASSGGTSTPPAGGSASKPSAGGGVEQPKPTPQPAPQPVPPASELQPTPPPGFTAAELSPYYQKVHLSGIGLIRNRGDVGGFTVSVDGSLAAPVNLTGWTLRSNKSILVARVPQAVAKYGTGSAPSDIVAQPGDYVVIRTSKSPIGNLRTNRCTGFLNGVYKLDISLPGDCPALYSRSELSALSGRCQSYIGGFSGCRLPTSDDYAAVGNLDGGQCRAFLDRFGYQNCYNTYATTQNFFYHEWRVWLDVTSLGMDPEHDRILLLDRNGLLADVYVY
ncbi:MAG: hypothetical protein Q7S84_00350 [bacterium]|nr:hypothetical protein [bacterium]